jgi:hypothetical protein
MFTHLKIHHPLHHASAKQATSFKAENSSMSSLEQDNPSNVPAKVFTKPEQPLITESFLRQTKYKKDSKQHKDITDKLTIVLAKQMLPFSLVDAKEFRNFVKVLDPRYEIPGRKYFSQKAIPAKYSQVQNDVKSALLKVNSFSCTTDAWSSVTLAPYLSLTIHFVTPEWQLQSFCLRTLYMPESHTGENIAAMLRSILRDYNIYLQQITCFTTDSGANMVKACRDMNVVRVPCFGHILHNSICNAIKNERLQSVVKLCRQIVTTFSHSFK